MGIKDQRSPIDFKDRPSPHQSRIESLISFYKDYANHDNTIREKGKKSISNRRQRSYGSLLDPSKFTSKLPAGAESPPRRLVWNNSMVERIASKADDPLPPPDELYTEEVNLEKIPTLWQQLKDPLYQPKESKDLWPCQLRLTGKKLHRCKGCDHILMKAEMNLSSIRFKIQQTALHSFPQIRTVGFSDLTGGEANEVILSVTNPLNYSITISFGQCSSKQLSRVKEKLASVVTPEGEFYLSANDDVVELLDGETDHDIEDNPEFVDQRMPGKLYMKFCVTPEVGAEETRFMFTIKFSHKSTIEADKENETSDVIVPVLVRLSKCY